MTVQISGDKVALDASRDEVGDLATALGCPIADVRAG
jgi:hypothetical protein